MLNLNHEKGKKEKQHVRNTSNLKKGIVVFVLLIGNLVPVHLHEVSTREILCGYVHDDPGKLIRMELCPLGQDNYIYLWCVPSAYRNRYMKIIDPIWGNKGGHRCVVGSKEVEYLGSCADCGGGSDLELKIWTDKGCESTYKDGSRVTIYYEANRDCYAVLSVTYSDGRTKVLDEGWLRGGKVYSNSGTLEGAGKRVLVISAEGIKSQCIIYVDKKEPEGDAPKISVTWHVSKEFRVGEKNDLYFTVLNSGGDAKGEDELTVSGYHLTAGDFSLRKGESRTSGWKGDFTVKEEYVKNGYVEITYYVEMWNENGTDTYQETRKVRVEKEEKTGSIRVFVMDDSGNELSGASVYLDDNYEGKTNSSGEYTIREVDPGSHTVIATKSGYEEDSERVSLSAGETETVYLTLEGKKGAIRVIVKDDSGQKLKDAEIYLDDNYERKTNSNGEYTIREVDPGSHTVRATKSGYEEDSERVSLSAGETETVYLILSRVENLSASISIKGLKSSYKSGDDIEVEVHVTNTGNVSHTFIVGFTIIDSDGEEHDIPYKKKRLSPGESETIEFSYKLATNAPEGKYQAVASVWEKDSGDGKLENRLDRNDRYFTVAEGKKKEDGWDRLTVETSEYLQNGEIVYFNDEVAKEYAPVFYVCAGSEPAPEQQLYRIIKLQTEYLIQYLQIYPEQKIKPHYVDWSLVYVYVDKKSKEVTKIAYDHGTFPYCPSKHQCTKGLEGHRSAVIEWKNIPSDFKENKHVVLYIQMAFHFMFIPPLEPKGSHPPPSARVDVPIGRLDDEVLEDAYGIPKVGFFGAELNPLGFDITNTDMVTSGVTDMKIKDLQVTIIGNNVVIEFVSEPGANVEIWLECSVESCVYRVASGMTGAKYGDYVGYFFYSNVVKYSSKMYVVVYRPPEGRGGGMMRGQEERDVEKEERKQHLSRNNMNYLAISSFTSQYHPILEHAKKEGILDEIKMKITWIYPMFYDNRPSAV